MRNKDNPINRFISLLLNTIVVESKEQQKYSYRYVFKASTAGTQSTKEADKNELLAYINEVLGIDKPSKKEGPQLTV